MKYYSFIDGLRALAVIPVILFHFDINLFQGGFIGVDIFFVISGFLITGVLINMMEKKKFSIIHFYERRARRILPALFLTCFISIICALILFAPHDFKSFSKSLEGVSIFGSNFIFARWVGYLATTAPIEPLLHTWSLAVEEQFYLIFPLILYFIVKKSKEKTNLLPSVIYISFMTSLIMNIIFVYSSPEKTFYFLHTRAWELLAGSILAINISKIKITKNTAEILSMASLITLFACFATYSRNTIFPGYAAILPVLATCTLIFSNIKNKTLTGRLLSTNPFIKIGLISYGLYLYHWPIIVFSRYYLDHDLTLINMLWAAPLLILISIISYIYIEQPIRTGKTLRTRKDIFTFSGIGIIILGVIGIIGVKSQGLPFRFDAQSLQYAAGAQDKNSKWLKCLPKPNNINEKTICKINPNNKKTPNFFVWGDSHALAAQPALSALSKRHALTGWMLAYGGCPPLLGVNRTDGHLSLPCKDIANRALEIIKENRIQDVIIISAWQIYALGWEKGGVNTTREQSIEYIDTNGSTYRNKEAFKESFKKTVTALKEVGVKNIWVMKQVPPQLSYIPSALSKATHLGHDISKLKRPLKDIIYRRKYIDDIFSQYKLPFIDPIKTLCSEKNGCLIEHKGRSLYSDNNHLSVYGSIWSKEMLTPFIKSIKRHHSKLVK